MDGVQYLVNEKGLKTAVVIDLMKHSNIWKEFYENYLPKKNKILNDEMKEGYIKSNNEDGELIDDFKFADNENWD
jgi:CRISPR/Cas system-associated protein Cas7 (RAMP superfamily)